jgi:hypothetical protein
VFDDIASDNDIKSSTQRQFRKFLYITWYNAGEDPQLAVLLDYLSAVIDSDHVRNLAELPMKGLSGEYYSFF